MMRFTRTTVIAVAAALALGFAACGDDDDEEAASGGAATEESSGGGQKIALLLPETQTTRYEAHDRPLFEAKVKELCADCEILYSNATQDAAKQQQQAEAAITQGANVLVLDPVDAASAASIVSRAKQSDIPVISYDRLIADADLDYYISYDNAKVGELQANSLLEALDGGEGKSIVMINGAPTDNNAKLFKQGAHSVFDGKVEIGKEYDTPEWKPENAQRQMEQAITALGNDGFDGVYAANDGTAGGAIAAMKGAGIDPSERPTTGQDVELAAVQRIIAGEQYMTVYKAIKPQADAAAELAVALAQGKEPPANLVNAETDNGMEKVPSVIFDPVAVTQENVVDTVIADEFVPVAEVCSGDFAAACAELGIS